jgi:small subunit ribosomal protein S18
MWLRRPSRPPASTWVSSHSNQTIGSWGTGGGRPIARHPAREVEALANQGNRGTQAGSSTGGQRRRSSRPRRSSGDGGDGGAAGRRFGRRRKTCAFCEGKVKHIDYKQTQMLRDYLTDRGKIRPRRQTGACAKHQRQISIAIKRARHLALLPFVVESGRSR